MEMESVAEPVPDHPSINNVKLNEVSDKSSSIEEDLSHKSNGVTETANAVPDSSEGDKLEALVECAEADGNADAGSPEATEETSQLVSTSVLEPTSETEVAPVESTESNEAIVSDLTEKVTNTAEIVDSIKSEEKNCPLNVVQTEEVVESEIESSDNVRFETEILVETNDNDINEIEIQDAKVENVSPNNILSELGQNIELSEVLRSSDVTENVENNNCQIRQEVFNKEELLDILEGNDVQPGGDQVVDILNNSNMLEAQLALQQLSRLKNNRKNRHPADTPKKKSAQKSTVQKTPVQKGSVQKVPAKKIPVEKESVQKHPVSKDPIGKDPVSKDPVEKDPVEKDPVEKDPVEKDPVEKDPVEKEEDIVNALVKDWDDDEPTVEQHQEVMESSTKPDQQVENVEIKEENTVDSSTGDGLTPDLNKSDDGQPQRRLGRVIKKKVIFDPDNPDTFTKSKTVKNKDIENEKDQHQPKKPKLEQSSVRDKSKSPVSKMQWKKPSQPKNSKQNKRLSEVDKLLMDEGAVNMIYQLTPEAPKGKKNMKTKAEFIKKLQSSTPETKEMKFRERKKELIKSEEGEAKKILSGKQRSSLSSSVKSPSVSEDFETHSADDSIIYRRHSSSSYSSSCMSPRRLSDVETNQTSVISSEPGSILPDAICEVTVPADNVFQPDSSVSNEIINKDDCMTIKKKLNSKLSMALNKRKRESGKTDKPIKKKAIKTDTVQEKGDIDNFKYLSLTFDQRVAEICIQKSGSKYNIEVLREIEEALSYINTRKDLSLTLMMSECGGLCSDLDLTSLLDNNLENRNKSAKNLAESVRSLSLSVERHSKVLCCSVWGPCSGVGLALLALSDVALAADSAALALLPRAADRPAPLAPFAPLAALRPRLSQNVINDLLIFGRQLSASEALQIGLVNRLLWPGGVIEQIRTIVRNIAAQPPQALLLKKKLLNIGKTPESTFQLELDREAALMVEYLTSDEGQESLRANIDAM